jgi:hypothetical protein
VVRDGLAAAAVAAVATTAAAADLLAVEVAEVILQIHRQPELPTRKVFNPQPEK